MSGQMYLILMKFFHSIACVFLVSHFFSCECLLKGPGIAFLDKPLFILTPIFVMQY